MKQCKAGTEVLNVDECKMACGYLGISRMGGFKEGRPCYKGGAGGCNQNVRKPGSKATRICKGIQIQIRCSTLYNDVINLIRRLMSNYVVYIFILYRRSDIKKRYWPFTDRN